MFDSPLIILENLLQVWIQSLTFIEAINNEEKSKGKTISLITSHIMSFVEEFLDQT